jgi:hypothetical protein
VRTDFTAERKFDAGSHLHSGKTQRENQQNEDIKYAAKMPFFDASAVELNHFRPSKYDPINKFLKSIESLLLLLHILKIPKELKIDSDRPQRANPSLDAPKCKVRRICTSFTDGNGLADDDRKLMPSFCAVIVDLGPKKTGAISPKTEDILRKYFQNDEEQIREFIDAIRDIGGRKFASISTCARFELTFSRIILGNLCGQPADGDAMPTFQTDAYVNSSGNFKEIKKTQLLCENLFAKIKNGSFYSFSENERKLIDPFCAIIKHVSEGKKIPDCVFLQIENFFGNSSLASVFIARILARRRGDIGTNFATDNPTKLDYSILAEQTYFRIAASGFRDSSLAGKVAVFVDNYRETNHKQKLELATAVQLNSVGSFHHFPKLLTSKGLLDKRKLENAIAAYIAYAKTPESVKLTEKLKKLLQIHENFTEIQGSLESITYEKFDANRAAKKLAMFSNWQPSSTLQKREAILRCLVFSATFDIPVRQERKVGSCFVAAPLIHLQANDPRKMLSLMASALTKGHLPLSNSRLASMEVPLNSSEGRSDLLASVNVPNGRCLRSLHNAILRTLADGEMQGGFDQRNAILNQAANAANDAIESLRASGVIDLPIEGLLEISYNTSADNSTWDGVSGEVKIRRGVWLPHIKRPGNPKSEIVTRDELLKIFSLLQHRASDQKNNRILKKMETWIKFLSNHKIEIASGGQASFNLSAIHGKCIKNKKLRAANTPLEIFHFFYEKLQAEMEASTGRTSAFFETLFPGTTAANSDDSNVFIVSGERHVYTINLTDHQDLRNAMKRGTSAAEAIKLLGKDFFLGIFDPNWHGTKKYGFAKNSEGELVMAVKKNDRVHHLTFEKCPNFLKKDLQVLHIGK